MAAPLTLGIDVRPFIFTQLTMLAHEYPSEYPIAKALTLPGNDDSIVALIVSSFVPLEMHGAHRASDRINELLLVLFK